MHPQITVGGTSIRPIDLCLAKKRKLGFERFPRGILNVLIAARFLSAELVAGEGKDLQSLLTVLLV